MDSYIYLICIHIYFFVRAFHVHGLHICIHYTRDKKFKEERKTFIERGSIIAILECQDLRNRAYMF